jgi:outer membrane protein OmpA-like peptidoglycan-associated protein
VRLLDYLTGLVSLLALPFIAWWSVNQSPQSAARLEARLEAKAQQALHLAGIDWASVDMDGQTAILTGGAPSGDAAEDAARIVLRSSGKGGVLFGGISQVENHVHTADPVRPYLWTAEKMPDGQLVLSGHVPSKSLRADLMLQAEAVSMGPAEDRMIVAAGAPEGNWQGIAALAISQVAELDAGSAVLEDNVLTVRGQSMDDGLRARVTGATGAVAAPFRGVALIRGVPLWSAELADGDLVLSGAVPAEADRRALLAIVRRGFEGGVRDEMIVAGTAAEGWVEGAKAGLAHFAAFGSGAMAFDPAINGFTFEGEAPASTLQFLNEDMLRAAGPWRFVIAAKAQAAGAEIAAEGPAETAVCAEDMNRMLESAAVGFVPGSAEFRRQDAEALDELAAIARLCGEGAALELEVSGDALAEARAAAMADYLERAGAARPRLAAINYGPAAGGRAMDTDAAAGSDRPLEFTVRERSGQ